MVGQLRGVALVDKRAADNLTTFQTDGAFLLSVKAVSTAGAGSAVAAGDVLCYVPANTPTISRASGDAGAVRFSYALAAITSTQTATIAVKVGY